MVLNVCSESQGVADFTYNWYALGRQSLARPDRNTPGIAQQRDPEKGQLNVGANFTYEWGQVGEQVTQGSQISE
jgi:hypothetical protein